MVRLIENTQPYIKCPPYSCQCVCTTVATAVKAMCKYWGGVSGWILNTHFFEHMFKHYILAYFPYLKK
jgi:hypothetical protein